MPLTDRSDSLVTRNLTVEDSLELGDDTRIEFKEMPAPATPPSGSLLVYAKTDGKLYAKNDAGTESDLTAGSAGGEANTASNVGVGGQGLFKQKTGVDLEFRNINAGSAKISVSLDAVNNEVDVDLGSVALADLTDGAQALKNVVEDGTPQLGGQLDVNGQALGDGTRELLKFVETASAVNEVTIKNAASGGAPEVQSSGDDVNIDLNLAAKGTGVVKAEGAEIATISGAQTLTNKTLTSPTIGDFTNATHDHQTAAGGGTLDAAAIASGTMDGARLAAKNKTVRKILYIEDPTAADVFPLLSVADNCTLVRVTHKTDTGTVDFNLEKRAEGTPATAGTNVWTVDKQASSTSTAETTFDSAAIPADNWLVYAASAAASSPTKLWITIEYTID